MPDAVTISIDSAAVLAALGRLARPQLRPALADIGEYLVKSTKERFGASKAPDGTPWPANSQVTVMRYLQEFGAKPKSKKGQKLAGSKKPLIGASKRLSSEIYPEVGDDHVDVGSGLIYAAMQQFGGKKSEFPHLWGDIPPRPFLGLSDDDERTILDIIGDHIRGEI